MKKIGQQDLFQRKYIVVDLDGTLCDSAHREHLARAKQWDEFHAGIPDDKPHWDVVDLLEVIATSINSKTSDLEVIALTGRNERYRIPTMKWLQHYRIKVDHLLMRPDDNWMSDHDLKPRLLVDYIIAKDWTDLTEEQLRDAASNVVASKVWFILEDRDKVVEAWRDLGFRCWQTQPGGY